MPMDMEGWGLGVIEGTMRMDTILIRIICADGHGGMGSRCQ